MSSERIPLQPTLRQLLELEALSEAQVIAAAEFLDKQVSQIVATLYGGQKAGTLAILRADALSGQGLLPLQVPGLISAATKLQRCTLRTGASTPAGHVRTDSDQTRAGCQSRGKQGRRS